MTLAAMARRDNQDGGVLRNPAYDAQAVTPADDTLLSNGVARGIYVGVTGDVTVTTEGGSKVTFKNAQQGTVIPIRVQSVESTNTTATNLLALY